jgi:hypothetical protein
MKKIILNSTLVVSFLIAATGCASKKKLISEPAQAVVVTPPAVNTKAETINSINSAQTVFHTFSVRAKADLTIDNNKNDVTMHIRIKKDEAIWISVTALAGLEVGRALITPDSIKVINRIESVYIKKPFSYVHEFTNRQINFKTLQSLFTGNAIAELVTEKADITTAPVLQLAGILEGLSYTMLFTDSRKLSQLHLRDNEAGRELKVNYSDFANVAGRQVPQQVSISSRAAKKQIGVDLKYNKIDIDVPVDMPFTVSKRFTVKN